MSNEPKKTEVGATSQSEPKVSIDQAQSRKNAEDRRVQKRAAKEQQRLNLWRSRVHLVREARDRFALKNYAHAVTSYERYLRVLEIVYEAKPNEIKVSSFNNSARQKEMVVIVGAYWDMVRVYDMSPRFKKRLDQCAEKLAEFLPFTPIYSELLKKIEEYKKVAKNKDVFERVLKAARKKKGRCFIATATFEDSAHPTVVTLQNYRDKVLLSHVWGRAFTQIYYVVSPPIADVIENSPVLKKMTRVSLEKMAKRINQKYNLK